MIYLDHNATTAPLRQAIDAMLPFLTDRWGNPSSAYRFGAESEKAIQEARKQVAEFVGCDVDEVLFTSGATEANNTAIHAALVAQPGKRHLITSKAEHSSVLEPFHAAEAQGATVTFLSVDSEGQVDLKALVAAIRPDTALVSLMWANNETGVLTPVPKVADICVQHGIPFHCDAVQAAGKIPLTFYSHTIDYLSISGHKLGAPKGVGALIVRNGSRFSPLIAGGKQEHGRRGGTESIPLIVAFGAACAAAQSRPADAWDHVSKMRDELEARILASLPGAYRNGSAEPRLPNTLNFGIPGIDSDGLVAFLDQNDICVSSGSACMESALAPSHVITAMLGDYERANEALRVSLGLTTQQTEIERFWNLLSAYVTRVLNHSAIESADRGRNSKETPNRRS